MTTICHPLYLLDRAVMVGMRTMAAPLKGGVTGPETLRAAKAALDDVGDFLRQCFKVETSVRSS